MKKTIALIVILLGVISTATSQAPSAVFVTFSDNKSYTARQINRTANDINVEFLHSHSIYTFNNQGTISSSTGAYPAGTKVLSISYRDYLKNITDELNMELYRTEWVGIRFSDNQIYYGIVEMASTNDIVVAFSHSGSEYGFSRENGSWVVHRIKGGTYKENDKISGIYLLGDLYPYFQ